MGLNEDELAANRPYNLGWKVFDLNAREEQNWTWFPVEGVNGEVFDTVICTVSIDYLIYPLEVLKECYKILKQGQISLHNPSFLFFASADHHFFFKPIPLSSQTPITTHSPYHPNSHLPSHIPSNPHCSPLTVAGTIHLAISNRYFATKAISLWLDQSESTRLELIANYLHFEGFEGIEVVEVVRGGDGGRESGGVGILFGLLGGGKGRYDKV